MANKVIGVVTQPNYLPWIGYFEQILYADTFVYLDNVQFPRREWCNRNKILNNGKPIWLTVPISKSQRGTTIDKIKINYQLDWITDHLKSIEYSYNKTPQFEAVFALVKEQLEKRYELLANLNISLINKICNYLKIDTKRIKASEKEYSQKRTELLAKICQNYGINHYYSSVGAKIYLDQEASILEKQGIEIEYQNYEPQKYKQHNSKDFIPYLSIIDLLFNLSKEEALVVIKAGAKH